MDNRHFKTRKIITLISMVIAAGLITMMTCAGSDAPISVALRRIPGPSGFEHCDYPGSREEHPCRGPYRGDDEQRSRQSLAAFRK